jgi:hypothetical protein
MLGNLGITISDLLPRCLQLHFTNIPTAVKFTSQNLARKTNMRLGNDAGDKTLVNY